MNTNVGDMPLDIYSDYISEQLSYEFSWIYFTSIENTGYVLEDSHKGIGRNYIFITDREDTAKGCIINLYGCGPSTFPEGGGSPFYYGSDINPNGASRKLRYEY